MRMKNKE